MSFKCCVIVAIHSHNDSIYNLHTWDRTKESMCHGKELWREKKWRWNELRHAIMDVYYYWYYFLPRVISNSQQFWLIKYLFFGTFYINHIHRHIRVYIDIDYILILCTIIFYSCLVHSKNSSSINFNQIEIEVFCCFFVS